MIFGIFFLYMVIASTMYQAAYFCDGISNFSSLQCILLSTKVQSCTVQFHVLKAVEFLKCPVV